MSTIATASRAPREQAVRRVLAALTITTLLAPAPSLAAQTIVAAPQLAPEPLAPAATGEHLPADQSAQPVEASPALLHPFADAIGDIGRLRSWDTVTWLAAGLGAALAVHPADRSVTNEFAESRTRALKPGAVLGGAPLQLGGAFAVYAMGRATSKPRVIKLGDELLRAQILSALATTGVKQSVRRVRPDGTSFSFPSGHAAAAFASATVLQRNLGWKVGVPAYGVASYVAASRVHGQRHYLSDVIFGATIGMVAGRTVSVGHGHRLLLSPTTSPSGGGGIAVTWRGKQ